MGTYREAGVDLDAADRHTDRIGPLVTATWGPQVVGGFGGFAAGVTLPDDVDDPVLMLTTDGVGTKLELARTAGRWDGVGFDLVAMCVDDLVAAGARPLAFVDYLAVGALDGDRDAAIVESIARACGEAGCALVGGETAEHPGVMAPDQVDLAGTALGMVARDGVLDPAAVRPGDVVVGLASPNLRSNGFSLVRRVFADADLDVVPAGLDRPLGEVLCEPSVIYAPAVLAAIDSGGVHAAAHVTGGGIPGNLVRALPEGHRAVIDTNAWERPPVFDLVAEAGEITWTEMARTFNLGVGFCLICDPEAANEVVKAVAAYGHRASVIGEVVAGERGVELTGLS